MTDRPNEGSEERRRTGPLGDEDRTRVDNSAGSSQDQDATRQIPSRQTSGEGQEPPRRLRRVSQASSSSGSGTSTPEEDEETRAIRTPSGTQGGTAGGAAGGAAGGTRVSQDTPQDWRESSYPRGYFEAADEREDRLRDLYGGVDWLASFIGFVFVLVVGAVFSTVAGLVLIPLGFSLEISGNTLEPAAITGLVVVAILLFLTYFFGGYVAGRLARFDGGRNGAMTVVWGLILALLLTVIGGVFGDLLPGNFIGQLQDVVQGSAAPAFRGLVDLGLVGLAIAAGVLLVELLGGILGGRVGARYHREIDRTT